MMYWNSVDEFLAMGGYGLYVWTSFGITVLCMAGEVLVIRRRFRALAGAARASQSSDQERG